MNSIMRIVSVVIFAVAITPSLSYGEEMRRDKLTKENVGAESLSPELRTLLTKEMLALQKGMMEIIPAYVAGNWAEIETIATKMKNSYILQQSLSKQQVKELHASLPHGFIKLDQQFHYLAGMLAHVASMKKSELVGFYFSKLSEACVSCHTQHAMHRFPALSLSNKTNEHAH